MNITVFPNKTAVIGGKTYRCALGKNGVTTAKVEGDGATPVGTYPLRQVFYRPDKVHPLKSGLPVAALTPADGWCDDSSSRYYNTFVKLPHVDRHEVLWREDAVYDIIVVVGYNDAPVVAGKGSAIFMHLMRDDYAGTEGCVAFSRDDLLEILEKLTPESQLVVEA